MNEALVCFGATGLSYMTSLKINVESRFVENVNSDKEE